MFTYKTEKLPKNTTELKVTVPWTDIQEEYEKAFQIIHKEFEMQGFRKGKVPEDLARKNIKKDDVYNQLVRSLLPRIYDDIVAKENLKPLISPQINLSKAKENEDWEILFKTAEKPVVELGDYKKIIQDAKQSSKKADIWVPGKDIEKNKQEEEKLKQKALQAALGALLNHVKVEISELIIQEELNQRLTTLVDDIQKVGLTVDSYLKSKNLTMEDLRNQHAKEIEDTYRLEFILQEIADKEGIQVEKEDLEKLFAGIKDEKEKQMAQQQAYFYASIMRKQKTLEYINSL